MRALEARLDEFAAANPNPGWRPFQRLNRAEYARAVKDLLDVDVDVSALLPPDTISHGFDNVADAQTFSPTLLEGYLRAASRVTALAVGDPDSSASEATYSLPKTASQLARADGAPLGTRGGLSVMHTFPADGDYVFRLDFFAEPLGILFGNTASGEQIEVSIDGERAAMFDINPRMNESTTGLSLKTSPVHVPAGPHRVTAAFLQRFEGPVNDLVAPIEHTLADTEIGIAVGITTLPHLRNLAVVGPHRVTGVSDTASRRRIFSCRPTRRPTRPRARRRSSAAWPPAPSAAPPTDREVARLMRFYDAGRQGQNFEAGVAKAVEAILASPQFLFRLEDTPATAPARSAVPARRPRAGVAAVVLRLGRRARPGAARRRGPRPARRRRGSRNRWRGCWPIPGPRRWPRASPPQWLRLQDLDEVSPDPILYPVLRPHAGAGAAEGDRALLRQPGARRPQRARPAHRRLLVRQRAGGAALRHPRT